jgi:hypothetical protein
LSLPGWARAAATRSASVLNGESGRTAITIALDTVWHTGMSACASYPMSLLRAAGNTEST